MDHSYFSNNYQHQCSETHGKYNEHMNNTETESNTSAFNHNNMYKMNILPQFLPFDYSNQQYNIYSCPNQVCPKKQIIKIILSSN